MERAEEGPDNLITSPRLGRSKKKGMLKVFTPFSFCKTRNKSLPDTHRDFMLMIFSRGREKGRA